MNSNFLGACAIAAALALSVSSCATGARLLTGSSPDSQTSKQSSSPQQANSSNVEQSKPLRNPAHAELGRSLSIDDFINPYRGRHKHKFGVAKADYKYALKHADSGHAYDAFLAAFAYWSGHYKQGKRNVSFGKGRSQEKSMQYMELASELGWPEASYMLYRCYSTQTPRFQAWIAMSGDATAGIRHQNKTIRGCIYAKNSWREYEGWDSNLYPKRNGQTARRYLERLAKQGFAFSAVLEVIPKTMTQVHPLDRLDARANMLIAQFKTQSLIYTAAQYAKANNQVFEPLTHDDDHSMYKETYSSACNDESIAAIKNKASLDEMTLCDNSENDGRRCPGEGYKYVREHLEACMLLAPNHAAWDNFYQQRLGLYHRYFDSKYYQGDKATLLQDGLKRYTAAGDKQKAASLKGLIKQVESNADALATNWANIRRQNRLAYEAEQKAKAEREAEEQRQADAEWAQRQAERAASDARHRKELQQGWKLDDFATGADLDRIQDQTMRDIRAQQSRLRLSSGSSAPANKQDNTSSPQSPRRDGGGKPTQLENCPPPPILGYCPEHRPKPCQFCAEASVWLSEWEAHCEPAKQAYKQKYASWESSQTQSCISKWKGSGKTSGKGKAK